MDNMVSLLLSHRSIRKFEDKSLTDEQIKIIVSCAQSASSSSFVQAYSIIGIKDKQKKKKLAEIAGNQPYVADNGHLFVFCADLYRHEVIGRKEGKDVT
ncbi:MAG: nitroreductase family protein, partial [Bacillota bacterium]|nr:nitroreductase family protein [Bacillota bacterium]